MKVRTFTKKDVAVEIADRLEATLVDSLTFTDELFVVLRDMLTDDYEKVRIEIRNFGVFEIKPTKAKPKARNPQTNQEIFVPAHKKTHFKPGKILRQYLKQPLK
ncbi:MAG: DNA-binding protein [Candidatus Marinimicrobia bacterium]|jgi:nucleoid DNA-binding protein|nr:DNA-binding protein [Candidatus Neomarinimicrobiota bacterium]MBS00498.1 DNA-binding protein [Candidatus Neomarinimicrobiota bacterium]MEC7935749.1 HU family DNA-binding protein [Candidatus Neomarinimicrobiota bacterium]MEC9027402.1 HU family DNA-binding protein [Candidatus Neomarinimicrobiota bacterium]MEC9106696.1 HU family DNA-binding protein [Candidatus Neomarinimicrobiota bacterium]|tara:strand:- start:581 stop:892 length:312 start_codon:yes stop_codon:yes gene_type:complete